MRKPRDFDADLKALEARANQLKTRKQQQLGELVIATGADALPIEELAGALLAAASASATSTATNDRQTREGWRKAGAAFFQRGTKASASGADRGGGGAPPLTAGGQPALGSGSAA
jgi:hypothetical protein